MSLLIQPAGNRDSRIHYRDTIENPVPFDKHKDLLGDDFQGLLRHFPHGAAPMWGVTPGKNNVNVSKYNKISVGDLVVFTRDGKAFAFGKVAYLLHHPEMAKAIWGQMDDGQTWEYMYAISDHKPCSLSYDELRTALNSKPGDNFMGFRVVPDLKALRVYEMLEEQPPLAPWDLSVGEVIKRTELHIRYGGARYGGIEPSGRTPNVFLFTSPSGEDHGYFFDGLQEDGTYFYTGDGRIGDQHPDFGGNKAILESPDSGKALRLFESTKQKGFVRYLGEFMLDGQPFHYEYAPDPEGASRRVIVFHLQPIGDSVGPSVSLLPQENQFIVGDTETGVVGSFLRAATPRDSVAVRREIDLQQRLEKWLLGKGVKVSGGRLVIEGLPSSMRPDLILPELKVVIEAKASTARGSVRQAIGQVLDYRLNIERVRRGESWTSAVLVPADLHPSIKLVLESVGIGLIYPDGEQFITSGVPL